MGSQVLHERDAVACAGSPTADLACLDQPASPRGCRAFLRSQAFLQIQAFLKASPKPEQSRSGGQLPPRFWRCRHQDEEAADCPA